jgi:hypothetical protein
VSTGTTPRTAPVASVNRIPSSSTAASPVLAMTTNSAAGSGSVGFGTTSAITTAAAAGAGANRTNSNRRSERRMTI